jgi:hypothetical protein
LTGSLLLLVSLASLAADEPPAAPRFEYGLIDKIVAYGVATSMDDPNCPSNVVCPKQAPPGFHYMSVHTNGRRFLQNILMAEGVAEIGDIVKMEKASRGKDGKIRESRVIEVAAKKGSDNPDCRWVDGDEKAYEGGVVCQGWSYKSITR